MVEAFTLSLGAKTYPTIDAKGLCKCIRIGGMTRKRKFETVFQNSAMCGE